MQSTGVDPASAGRRRGETTGLLRNILARVTSGDGVRFDSWFGAIWTVVIALDFFWLSNPIVLLSFDESLHKAWVTTLIGVLATLPRFQLPRPSWAVLAVLLFGFASALWSTSPGTTAHFTATFLLIAVLATVAAATVDARTIAHGMTLGGVLVLAVSWYALHEGMPRADVPEGGTGFLAGLGGNRNVLAYTMLLALAFAISFVPRHWWARSIWGLATTVILLGIYLAQSATGYAVTLIVLTTGAVLMAVDRRRRPPVRSVGRRWAMSVLALLALVGAVVAAEPLGKALGRDPATLSGRVPLWKAIWSSTTGADRWVGSGWGTLWPHSWNPAPDSPAYHEIIDRLGFVLYHGHNSMFDLLPEVGILGVVVYALTYVHATVRALRLRDPEREPTPGRLEAGRATLLGVLALVLYGITEPMSTAPLGWFIAVMLATGLRPRRSANPVGAGSVGRHRGPRS